MGKIILNNLEQYKPKGQFEFFNLKNDGDVAEIRFMYESLDDFDPRNVHQLEMKSGKKIYIDCLKQNFDDLDSVCPCCAGQNKSFLMAWIPMYDVREKKMVLWSRGYNFISSVLVPALQSIVEKNNGAPIYATRFIIERHGEAGDDKTYYTVDPLETDDFILQDLGEEVEIPTAIGTVLHEKTYDELSSFMRNGYFGNFDKGGNTQRRSPNAVSGSESSVADIIRKRGTRPTNI